MDVFICLCVSVISFSWRHRMVCDVCYACFCKAVLVFLSFSQNKTSSLKCKSQYLCPIFSEWVLFWTLNLPMTKHWCMFVMLMKAKSSLCGLFCQLPWQRRTLVWLKLNSVTVRTPDDARSPTLWYLGLENEILIIIAYAQNRLLTSMLRI